MGNTVVKNKSTGDNITNQFNKNKLSSIKVGNKITSKNNKEYTIVDCNEKSYGNSLKNMRKSMGKMGTSMTSNKTMELANNKKKNSVKITKEDIENVENLFKLNDTVKFPLYGNFEKNIGSLSKQEYPYLRKIIADIYNKNFKGFNQTIDEKFKKIYLKYYKNKEDILKEKPNEQRINNQPKNNNNVTNKYDINQQRLIKLFSTIYEYYKSNKTPIQGKTVNNKNKSNGVVNV
jgi:hypothetical protein